MSSQLKTKQHLHVHIFYSAKLEFYEFEIIRI